MAQNGDFLDALTEKYADRLIDIWNRRLPTQSPMQLHESTAELYQSIINEYCEEYKATNATVSLANDYVISVDFLCKDNVITKNTAGPSSIFNAKALLYTFVDGSKSGLIRVINNIEKKYQYSIKSEKRVECECRFIPCSHGTINDTDQFNQFIWSSPILTKFKRGGIADLCDFQITKMIEDIDDAIKKIPYELKALTGSFHKIISSQALKTVSDHYEQFENLKKEGAYAIIKLFEDDLSAHIPTQKLNLSSDLIKKLSATPPRYLLGVKDGVSEYLFTEKINTEAGTKTGADEKDVLSSSHDRGNCVSRLAAAFDVIIACHQSTGRLPPESVLHYAVNQNFMSSEKIAIVATLLVGENKRRYGPKAIVNEFGKNYYRDISVEEIKEKIKTELDRSYKARCLSVVAFDVTSRNGAIFKEIKKNSVVEDREIVRLSCSVNNGKIMIKGTPVDNLPKSTLRSAYKMIDLLQRKVDNTPVHIINYIPCAESFYAYLSTPQGTRRLTQSDDGNCYIDTTLFKGVARAALRSNSHELFSAALAKVKPSERGVALSHYSEGQYFGDVSPAFAASIASLVRPLPYKYIFAAIDRYDRQAVRQLSAGYYIADKDSINELAARLKKRNMVGPEYQALLESIILRSSALDGPEEDAATKPTLRRRATL